jgi:hypothetical protein
MLKRLIKAVRRKPKVVRDQYAFVIAVSFTAVVLLFWVLSFSDTVQPVESIPSPDAEQGADPSSFRDMITDWREGFGEMTTDQPAGTTSANAAVAPLRASTSTQTAPRPVESAATSAPPAAEPVIVPSALTQPEVRIATFTATSTP